MSNLSVSCVPVTLSTGQRRTAQSARETPGDHAVSVCAQPGDDMEHGEGFYVFEEPSRDLEPIAPYRQSSLNTVADAACDVISTWRIPPVAK